MLDSNQLLFYFSPSWFRPLEIYMRIIHLFKCNKIAPYVWHSSLICGKISLSQYQMLIWNSVVRLCMALFCCWMPCWLESIYEVHPDFTIIVMTFSVIFHILVSIWNINLHMYFRRHNCPRSIWRLRILGRNHNYHCYYD